MSWQNDPVIEEQKGGWQNDPVVEEKTTMGAVKNLATDIKDTGKGLYEIAKTANPVSMVTDPIGNFNKVKDIATGIPHGLMNEAKRIGGGELLGGNFSGAANKFGNALYDKPLTTTLDVLPLAGGAMKGIEAMRGVAPVAEGIESVAPVAAEAPATQGFRSAIKLRGKTYTGEPGELHVDVIRKIAEKEGIPESELYDTINKIGDQGFTQGDKFLTREEASQAAGGVKGEAASMRAAGKMNDVPPSNIPGIVDETVSALGNKAKQAVQGPLGEVEDFLSQKYGKAAKTPGAIQNLGKAFEQKGKGMTLKEIGGTPGMGRTLKDRFGQKAVEDLADLAEKRGITKGFFNFQTGNAIEKLMKESGQKVGAIREIASKRGAIHDPEMIVKQIRQELDPVYLKGSGTAQKKAYMNALEDIKNAPKDPVGLAKTITEKNAFLKKNKLTQPIGAGTDVLNTASRLNNELIANHLSPVELKAYQEALKDFSASKVYDKMYGYTYGRDMFGRSGPASPINFIKDIGGRKILQKVFSRVGKRMQSSPESFGSPTELSSDVLDSISDALDEVIDQMGGEAQK